MKNIIIICLLGLFLLCGSSVHKDRGEIGSYGQKYIWTNTGEAFVPNFIMIDVLANQRESGPDNDLSKITADDVDHLTDVFFCGHGFNGIHIPVYGQWFHIGENKVSDEESVIDQRSFDRLKMIINKVYYAGGCTHIWLWGDDSRSQTSASLKDGIMGNQEKQLLDEIARQLGPLKGWTMGYGYDLWEWVSKEELNAWHDYLWSKPGWNHMLGARSSKNELDQLSERMDYAGYEYHKPGYEDLVRMINERPGKPSFSEDRYRIRTNSKYPDKDYNEEETRRGLWYHTMAGGVAAIWGNLSGNGGYSNKDALKCFSVFWNDKGRFRKDMVISNGGSDAYCLSDRQRLYVFYKEDAASITYHFEGKPKLIKLIDTRKAYREIPAGKKKAGLYTMELPYASDWALVAE